MLCSFTVNDAGRSPTCVVFATSGGTVLRYRSTASCSETKLTDVTIGSLPSLAAIASFSVVQIARHSSWTFVLLCLALVSAWVSIAAQLPCGLSPCTGGGHRYSETLSLPS